MIIRKRAAGPRPLLLWSVALCSLILTVNASLGDHLPEFRECVSVWPHGIQLLLEKVADVLGLYRREL